jgi:hypothetical protein
MTAISPLLAAVMLIAFVVAAFALVSGPMLDFIRGGAETTVTHGEEKIKCIDAGLYIRSVDYSCTEDRLDLEVENVGMIDLENFKLQIRFVNRSTISYGVSPAITLEPAEIQSFSAIVTNSSYQVGGGFDELFFFSKTCPVDSRDRFDGGEVKISEC